MERRKGEEREADAREETREGERVEAFIRVTEKKKQVIFFFFLVFSVAMAGSAKFRIIFENIIKILFFIFWILM